jgi:hypothetical protein
MSHQKLFHLRPVDNLINFFQSFKAAVMFHRFQKRYFGEGHVLIDLFVSISPPERNLMAEIWHKYGDMSSDINYLL